LGIELAIVRRAIDVLGRRIESLIGGRRRVALLDLFARYNGSRKLRGRHK
jgi:hypothetical protein